MNSSTEQQNQAGHSRSLTEVLVKQPRADGEKNDDKSMATKWRSYMKTKRQKLQNQFNDDCEFDKCTSEIIRNGSTTAAEDSRDVDHPDTKTKTSLTDTSATTISEPNQNHINSEPNLTNSSSLNSDSNPKPPFKMLTAEESVAYRPRVKTALDEEIEAIIMELYLAEDDDPRYRSLRQLFKGVCIYVNGYTDPVASTLYQIMRMTSGQYSLIFEPSRTTHTVAVEMSQAQLRSERAKRSTVRPAWIVDSLRKRELVPIYDYLLAKPSNGIMDFFVKREDLKESIKDLNLSALNPSTSKSTTLYPSASKSTSLYPSASKSTTLYPSASKATTSNPLTLNPSTSKATTSYPSTSKSTTLYPSASKSTTLYPSASKATTSNPLTLNPSTSKATTSYPSTSKSTTSNTLTLNPSTSKATTSNPSTSKATTLYPSTSKATTSNPSTSKATTSNPSTSKATTSYPSTSNPSTSKSTTLNPSTSNPSTSKATTSNPSTSNPSTSKSTTLYPSTSNPSTSKASTLNPSTPKTNRSNSPELLLSLTDDDDDEPEPQISLISDPPLTTTITPTTTISLAEPESSEFNMNNYLPESLSQIDPELLALMPDDIRFEITGYMKGKKSLNQSSSSSNRSLTNNKNKSGYGSRKINAGAGPSRPTKQQQNRKQATIDTMIRRQIRRAPFQKLLDIYSGKRAPALGLSPNEPNLCGKIRFDDVCGLFHEWILNEPVLHDQDISYVLRYFSGLIDQNRVDELRPLLVEIGKFVLEREQREQISNQSAQQAWRTMFCETFKAFLESEPDPVGQQFKQQADLFRLDSPNKQNN